MTLLKIFQKDFPEEIEELEKTGNSYISGNDLQSVKKEFPDKMKYLNKNLAYHHEYFISIDYYQKPVKNLEKNISSAN